MIPIELSCGSDAGEIGGKAANLSRMLQAGMPVPPGFVLPRSVLRQFLIDHQLSSDLAILINGYAQNDWQKRQESYKAFCFHVRSLPVSSNLLDSINPIVLAWLNLNIQAGLAVRSSFIHEDSSQASFAGVFSTQLGINSLDSFWQSVIHCWCSAWSPQAAAYAAKMDILLPPDGMAVLVQPVIAACCSGVLFTADPVSGNPWHFILNAVPGMGQRLVDGTAPADRWVLNWDDSAVLEQFTAVKPTALYAREGLIYEEALSPAAVNSPVLSEQMAQQIARTGLVIDRLFDRRMDIEWAIDDQQIWILQARPITALPLFFPHTLSPIDALETWTPYLNTWGTLNPHERLVAPIAWDRWESQMWRQYLEPGDIFPHLSYQERDFNGYRYATPRRWESGGPPDPGRIEAWLVKREPQLRKDWLRQLERVLQVNAALDQAFDQDHTPAQWARLLVNYAREERLMQTHVWYAPQWLGFTCEFLLKDFLKQQISDQAGSELLPGLLQGLSCYSVERAAAAQDLAQRIQEPHVRAVFAALPLFDVVPYLRQQHPHCRFLVDFNAFCLQFGVEPPAETLPRPVGQDIDGILLVIKNRLLDKNFRDANQVLAASAEKRKTIESQVRSLLLTRQPDQVPHFDQLLAWTHFWVPALDNRKWHCTMTTSLRWGRLLKSTGQSLSAANLIARPDHVSMLTLDEWSSFAEDPDPQKLRQLYESRLHEYEHNRRLEPLPYLGASPHSAEPKGDDQSANAQPQGQQPATNQTVFIGQGLAPGKVRGKIRRISNMDAENYADQLSNEDILVCGPASFTAEWRRDYYALFLVVRGMVAVQGAQLHHATQVARECGVPLVNLPEADLEQLPDGGLVEIDGLNGTVTLSELLENHEKA